MKSYEITPDGLVRRAGKVQDDIAPWDPASPLPSLPQLLPDIDRQDEQAASQFNRVAQVPAATHLTVS